jgi:hypothetical protein
MGIGVGLFLLAVGAILTFAVEVDADGFDINTVGIILMIVGGLGVLLGLLFWGDRAPWRREERVVVRDREVL